MSKDNVKNERIPSASSSPRAFKEHEVEEYERKRYRGIDQKLVHRRETRILERLLGRIASAPGNVLDVPCGYGRFSSLLGKKGWPLASCDYSFSMVKRARESGKESGIQKNWGVVADAKKGLPFKENTFPILLCMRFWHHVHDPLERRAILGFFSGVTSGWLILSFYKVNALHRMQRSLRRKLKRSPTRIKMIAEAEFFSEIAEAGFECLEMVPLFPGIHAQHVALLQKIRI